MRSRTFVCAFLAVGILAAGTLASSGDRASPTRQWAIAYLTEPTLIGSTMVQGPVLFTHDRAKMARGEPCTSVRLFDPAKGPSEEIAAFHCIPIPRRVVGTFTVRTRPNEAFDFGCILAEFQFAGDAEAHGMPIPADAN